MVTIQNKKITIEVEGIDGENKPVTVPIELTYGKLILDCSDRASNPQTGFSTDEIRKINKIEKVVKTHEDKEHLKFEDADFEFLKEKVSTMTWRFRKTELVEFVDYIKSLKTDA